MRALLFLISVGGVAAVTLLAYRAYVSVEMQVAWEQLLAFCGH